MLGDEIKNATYKIRPLSALSVYCISAQINIACFPAAWKRTKLTALQQPPSVSIQHTAVTLSESLDGLMPH